MYGVRRKHAKNLYGWTTSLRLLDNMNWDCHVSSGNWDAGLVYGFAVNTHLALGGT